MVFTHKKNFVDDRKCLVVCFETRQQRERERKERLKELKVVIPTIDLSR